MVDAHKRIVDIQARDPKIDALLKQKNVKAVCAILKTNIADMTAARDGMARCLPGFDKNEQVITLNANLAALGSATTALCK